MEFSHLDDWLAHLETVHKTEIDLGLERVGRVKQRLVNAGALRLNYPIITVGGTNGKGSTCAYLEHILLAAGYRVACHTSPHILHFTERARWCGQDAQPEQLLPYFQLIEKARTTDDEISLTYYEFTLLAILCWFDAQTPDAVILEVGLGGRLDATNVFDAEVAVITSIDLDHTQFLGHTREAIAYEKAGIFRTGKTAVCADPSPPCTLIDHAHSIGAHLKCLNQHFSYQIIQDDQRRQWRFIGERTTRNSLAMPAMRGDYQLANASAALMAIEALHEQLPVPQQAVRLGLSHAVVRGRFQVLPGQPVTVLDVAHNPHAARALAKNINQLGYAPYTYAVFGAMADKDIAGVIAPMRSVIDHWCLCDLPSPRAADTTQLHHALTAAGFVADKEHTVTPFTSVAHALAHLAQHAAPNDRIVVFGSFVTVQEALLSTPPQPIAH